MKNKKLIPLYLSVLSAILFSAGWYSQLLFPTILVAFVPLLILQKLETPKLLWWVILTFELWIVATCWWVSIATVIAAVVIPIGSLFFMLTPFALYYKLKRKTSQTLSWVLFVTLWVSFEGIYTYNEISFPWLVLGNVVPAYFAQWYSVTGVFGGSIWILISNILVFKVLENRWLSKKNVVVKRLQPIEYATILWILIPTLISSISYHSYTEESNPVDVAVIQPNIDPYKDKFNGMTNQKQLKLLLSLSSQAPVRTQFFVMPETAINDNVWINSITMNRSVIQFQDFLEKYYPNATIITGATTFSRVPLTEPITHDVYTGSNNFRYRVHNSALWIDTTDTINHYHKSKLVIGAETIPYPFVLEFISNLISVDLGGFTGRYTRSQQRSVFKYSGTAICYEGIYGDFFTDYANEGAEIMFIVSNDGWWGNTLGHRHLIRYAQHRAIENRRSIARSANTGISALINQRGEVIKSIPYNTQGIINGTINKNKILSIYTIAGDYLLRLSYYILALSLLYLLSLKYRKKL